MLSLCDYLQWNRPKIQPWVILVCAAINMIFLGGKRRAFGTFVAVLHKDFNRTSLTELNWIGDSYAAFGYMSSSLSIAAILYFNRRYWLFQFIGSLCVLISCITSAYVPNPHWLFLTHTVIHGVGSSLVISVVGLVVNDYFDKKHPYHLLATMLVSGGSVAAILFVYLFAYLIQTYNWRNALIILGVLYFVVLTLPVLVFKRKHATNEVLNEKRTICSCEGIRCQQVPLLILWFIDRVMTSVVTYGLLLNLTDYIHRIQPSLLKSTTLTSLFAAGEGSTYLIGAIITAATRDFFRNKLRYILFVSSVVFGGSLIGLELTKHIAVARQTLCFVAGFSMGPSITFLFPAGEELTQLPGHLAYPFSLCGMGFGMLISPLLTAKIAETFHYKWFFMIQGFLIFIKVVCLGVIILLLWFYRRRLIINDYNAIHSGDSTPYPESTSQEDCTIILQGSDGKHDTEND